MRIQFFIFGCLIILVALTSGAFADVILTRPGGEKIEKGMELPAGYYWLNDGTLVTPQKIKIYPNGDIDVSSATIKDPIFDNFTDIRADNLVMPDGNIVAYSQFGKAPRRVENDVNRRNTVSDDLDSYLEETAGMAADERFGIPEASSASKDLDFLNGCWRADEINYYTNPTHPYKAPAEFCFRGDGRGTFYAYPKGTECVSDATAEFRGDFLFITTSKGTCEQGKRFLIPRTFRCEGSGRNTACYTVATYKGQTYTDQAFFHKSRRD